MRNDYLLAIVVLLFLLLITALLGVVVAENNDFNIEQESDDCSFKTVRSDGETVYLLKCAKVEPLTRGETRWMKDG